MMTMRRTHRVEDSSRPLLRLLSGELSEVEAEALRHRLAEEPDLRRHYDRLAAVWSSLEMEEPAAAPVGFARRIARRVEATGNDRVRWSLAPIWAQATAAVALAGGIALGLGLTTAVASKDGFAVVESDASLAESYWILLDEAAGEPLLEYVAE